MLKKKIKLINICSKNNLYLSSIIINVITIQKKLTILIFSRKNANFLSLESNLC